MQLKFFEWNSLISRLLVSAFIIIFILGLSLAWLVNELHAQKSFNVQTEQLMADIPQAIKEIKQQHLNGLNHAAITAAPNNIDFIMVSCSADYKQLWVSKSAAHQKLNNICQKYKKISDQQPPYYIQLSANKDYLAYSIPLETNMQKFELLVLKDAKGFSKDYVAYSKHTFIKLLIILAITFAFMIVAAIWGLKPFINMKKELDAIRKGKQDQIIDQYPTEFETLSSSINQLIKQSQVQSERYKNTSDDLAHSLKTRLASIKAVMETQELDPEEMRFQISEHINQVNNSVNYHLKRATLGKNSLVVESTELCPVIMELESVLQKVYQEKSVHCSLDIEPKTQFPGNHDDLTELCGNLLENAFKLCLSEVHVEANITEGVFSLIIEDDGLGIDQSIRDSILKRGFRADTQHHGNGIGLAVCNEIVLSYNGQIKFEDSKLGGAKVIVQVPVS